MGISDVAWGVSYGCVWEGGLCFLAPAHHLPALKTVRMLGAPDVSPCKSGWRLAPITTPDATRRQVFAAALAEYAKYGPEIRGQPGRELLGARLKIDREISCSTTAAVWRGGGASRPVHCVIPTRRRLQDLHLWAKTRTGAKGLPILASACLHAVKYLLPGCCSYFQHEEIQCQGTHMS